MAVVFALLALLASAPAAASAPTLSIRVIEGFRSGSVREFHRALPEVDIPAHSALRDVLESYSEIEVNRFAVMARDGVHFELELDANGTTWRGERQSLPRHWSVDSINGRVVIRTSAEALVSSLLDGPRQHMTSGVATAASPDLVDASARMVTGDACRFHFERCRELGLMLRDEACTRALPELAAFAELAIATSEADGSSAVALSARRDAVRLVSQSPDADRIATVYLIAARLAESNPAERSENLEYARAYAELADPRLRVQSTIEAGNGAILEFQMTDAFALYEEAGRQAQRWGFARGEALSEFHRARASASSGHYPAAKSFAESAESHASEIGDRELHSRGLNLRGQAIQRAGETTPAIVLFREALAVVPETSIELRSIIQTNLAGSLHAIRNTVEAERVIADALVLARKSRSTWLAVTLNIAAAIAHALGRYDSAVSDLEESLRTFRGNRIWVVWALQENLALVKFECGAIDAAIDLWYESIDAIEARRRLIPSSPAGRARYFAEYEHVYASLTNALVRAGRLDEALAVSEKVRARVLADDLSLPDTPAGQTVLAASETVGSLNRALTHADAGDAARLREQLRAARALLDDEERLAALRDGVQVAESVAADDLNVTLPERSAVVQLVCDFRANLVIALVLTPAGLHGIELPMKLTELRERATRLRALISSRNWRYADEARPLYDALVAPLLPLIGTATHLTVVPSGFLWDVPFESLLDESRMPLDEKFVVAYAPSVALMNRPRRVTNHRAELLLLATAGPRTDAAFAAQIANEGSSVASLYDRAHAQVLQDDRATETRFKELAPGARVLHIAAHGISDATQIFSGGVFLSSSSADDGVLEAREVARMKLSADLVFLAGCRTGSGSIVAAEGPMGLGWSFLVAGARTAIVSRWSVSDNATAELSVQFHRLLRQNLAPAEALRQARRRIRRDPRLTHPYYWAAFMSLGATGR